MKYRSAIGTALCAAGILAWAGAAAAPATTFTINAKFFRPPAGMDTIGATHGDIAVAPNGEVFVSVQIGAHPGLQVYSSEGRYLRNVPDAPNDLHAFIIVTGPTGEPHLFGVRLGGQEIEEMKLDGQVVLRIPAAAIPDRYKTLKNGELLLRLSGIAVAPDGDIYVVDGYGRDFIHRFDRTGRYLGTFGGRGKPWEFEECHKIAIDPRYRPMRLLCADRLNGRIVQMDLDGHVLGTFARDLRRPSAMAAFKNELAVAELGGRVSVLDMEGKTIATIGTNNNPEQIKTDQVPPQDWQPNLLYAPHGITYDSSGNLLLTEWSQWGRILKLERTVPAG